jgi:hypothetical protein
MGLASGIFGSSLYLTRPPDVLLVSADSGRLRRGYFLRLWRLFIRQRPPPREADPRQASGQGNLLAAVKFKNERADRHRFAAFLENVLHQVWLKYDPIEKLTGEKLRIGTVGPWQLDVRSRGFELIPLRKNAGFVFHAPDLPLSETR